MRKHDDASFHYGGHFPDDLPDVAGGTHIGHFVAWLVINDLFAPELYRRASVQVDALRRRAITGREFLFDVLDEKLLEEDLTDAGHRFATDYYEELYLDDYIELLVPEEMDSIYRASESWENYDALAPRIDARYTAWSKDGQLTLPPC